MTYLLLGLVLFLGTHAFTMNRAARAAVIGKLSENGYKGVYTLLSLAGFFLIIKGYGDYRAGGYIQVWDPPKFLSHVAFLLMLPVFTLLFASQTASFIRAKVRHPMLLGIKLWATAHLLANGDLGSILLFGGFLVWAVISRISLKRRADAKPIPAVAGWTSTDSIITVVGLGLYVAFILWLHTYLIGVSPLGA